VFPCGRWQVNLVCFSGDRQEVNVVCFVAKGSLILCVLWQMAV
jgi:hypothetical protein